MKRKLPQIRNSLLIAILALLSLLSLTGAGVSPAQTSSALPGRLAPNGAPSASAHVARVPVERLLNPDGTLKLNDGFSSSLDLRGWDVALDSNRGPILTRQSGGSQEIATRSTISNTWSPLPNNGLNGIAVTALAVSGSDLYVGGLFTATADSAVTNLNNIAKFSGGAWSALPNKGLNAYVGALAVNGSDLYAGGDFTASADGAVTNLNDIAKFSGGSWSALPNNGLNRGLRFYAESGVHALAVNGSDLYVSGLFTGTADSAVTNLNDIAKFSGGAWSPLPNKGLGFYDTRWPCGSEIYYYPPGSPPGYNVGPARTYALAVSGNDLYVGGESNTTYDCTVTSPNGLAKFSGGAWSALPNNGLREPPFGPVRALAVSGSDLYVGGSFHETPDGGWTTLNRIAKFSGGAWSALPNYGLNGYAVYALAVSGNDLYVGGSFNATRDGAVTNLNNIAKFSGGAWSALLNNGLNGPVYALAVNGNDLYVGGSFTATADGAVTNLNNIAKFSGDVDTDGDGLLDEWETNGITLDGGAGPRFIDLPAMGADPNKPDIFLQIDWMQDATHNQKLSPDALKIVVNAFANSPYVSPTGSIGINLHIDQGPESILDYVSGATWGALGKAHAISYVANLGTDDASGEYVWTTDFQAIKDATGGFTQSGRTRIFHYVIAAHNHGATTSSGVSRGIGASDLIVSLGSFTGGVGSVNEQAGTLMHELGHNLNLRHGGGDGVNGKPNYLSIMNYAFQMKGVAKGGVDGAFDYSRYALGALDETNLNESVGLGALAAGYGTRHYCASTGNYEPVAHASAAIDWNCNGNSTDVGVVYDTNGDNLLCISPGPDGVLNTVPAGDDVIWVWVKGRTRIIRDGPNRRCDSTAAGDDVQEKPVGSVQPSPLNSFNDWANVKLKVGGIGHAGVTPILAMTSEEDLMTVEEASKYIPFPLSKLFLPFLIK